MACIPEPKKPDRPSALDDGCGGVFHSQSCAEKAKEQKKYDLLMLQYDEDYRTWADCIQSDNNLTNSIIKGGLETTKDGTPSSTSKMLFLLIGVVVLGGLGVLAFTFMNKKPNG